jgi:hypothetical protein
MKESKDVETAINLVNSKGGKKPMQILIRDDDK